MAGESEQRLYALDAWREASFYSERGQAALARAEAVTLLTEGHVPDTVYDKACDQFSEQELIDLTMAIITINGYSRINVAFRAVAGSYEPGMFAVKAK